MNKNKKNLDLIASIISLILGGYLVLGGSVVVAFSLGGPTDSEFAIALRNIFLNYGAELLVMGVVILFASILLIVATVKTWRFITRLIFEIILAVVNLSVALYYVVRLEEAGWFMIYIIPIMLLIVAMFFKDKTVTTEKTQ